MGKHAKKTSRRPANAGHKATDAGLPAKGYNLLPSATATHQQAIPTPPSAPAADQAKMPPEIGPSAAKTRREPPSEPQHEPDTRMEPPPKPQPKPAAEAAQPVSVAVPLTAWQPPCGVAVTGLSHWRAGLPCQDAVAWRSNHRPILAVSDGAGSAAVSERGAAALVTGVTRLFVSLEDLLVPWLDKPAEPGDEQSVRWAERLLAHAQGILEDLAQKERRDVRDLRATLLVAVIGTIYTFWWQVGDGAIVVRNGGALQVLGDPSKRKGEYSNQTIFVDKATIAQVEYGLLPTAELSGIALMSDGGAEKLVASDGSRVAGRVGAWFEAVASKRLTPDKIVLAFHDPAMWERTNLDDRSIVLTARPWSENFQIDGSAPNQQIHP